MKFLVISCLLAVACAKPHVVAPLAYSSVVPSSYGYSYSSHVSGPTVASVAAPVAYSTHSVSAPAAASVAAPVTYSTHSVSAPAVASVAAPVAYSTHSVSAPAVASVAAPVAYSTHSVSAPAVASVAAPVAYSTHSVAAPVAYSSHSVVAPTVSHSAVVSPAVRSTVVSGPAQTTVSHSSVVGPAVHSTVVAPAARSAVVAAPAVAHSAVVATPTVAHSAVVAAPTVVGVERTQYHAQDDLGQAAYGHSEAFQAHNAVQDAHGNKIGSYSYVAPDGQVIAANYVADALGYRVTSNAAPVESADVVAARAAHLAEVEVVRHRSRRSPVFAAYASPLAYHAATPVAATYHGTSVVAGAHHVVAPSTYAYAY